MSTKKDHSKFSLEELVQEEIKLKKSQKIISIIACLAVGVTLYAIYKKNVNFIHSALPIGCVLYLGNLAEKIKNMRNEIVNKHRCLIL